MWLGPAGRLQCLHLHCTGLVLKAVLGRVHHLQSLLYTSGFVDCVRQICAVISCHVAQLCPVGLVCSVDPTWRPNLTEAWQMGSHNLQPTWERGEQSRALYLEIVQSFPFCFSSILTDTFLSNASLLPAVEESLTGMQFLITTLFCFYILFFPVSCMFSLLKPQVMYVCYCFVCMFSARINRAVFLLGLMQYCTINELVGHKAAEGCAAGEVLEKSQSFSLPSAESPS